MLIFHYSLRVLILCEFTTTDGAASVSSLTLTHSHSFIRPHCSRLQSKGVYFYEAWFQSPVIAEKSKWTCGNTECVSAQLSVFFTLIVLWHLIVVCCLQHSNLTMKAIDNGSLTLCLHERGTAPNSFRWVQGLCGMLTSGIPKCHLMMQYKDRSDNIHVLLWNHTLSCIYTHFVYPGVYFLFFNLPLASLINKLIDSGLEWFWIHGPWIHPFVFLSMDYERTYYHLLFRKRQRLPSNGV